MGLIPAHLQGLYYIEAFKKDKDFVNALEWETLLSFIDIKWSNFSPGLF